MKENMIEWSAIDLSSFRDRQAKLSLIKRFSVFDTMHHRMSVYDHAQRVSWIVEELLPIAQKTIVLNPEKARTLALVHDDAEMITGDVQLCDKLQMTDDQLAILRAQEARAIEQLSSASPRVANGFSYRNLLLNSLFKDCTEAQLVSFADKIDAICECIHEVHAGNMGFIPPIQTYVQIIQQYKKKFPPLAHLFRVKHPFLDLANGGPLGQAPTTPVVHSFSSVTAPGGMPAYDLWKKITVDHGRVDWLIERKEQ